MNTEDIKNEFIRKYKNEDFRYLYNHTVKTVEIQNAHFICDKDWIIREPNYDYAKREIEWYKSQSLFVEDIPGNTPKIWNDCADSEGMINSNYGWCIWSNENGNQYKSCINTLVKDPYSRQAVMLYTRPSMQKDATKNGKHDFMCTYSVQCFLNDKIDDSIPGVLTPYYELKYIVYMRSNDAVYGFDNDILWHKYVQEQMCKELSEKLQYFVKPGNIEWNAGSLHVYERHFKFLENNNTVNFDNNYSPIIKKWCVEHGISEGVYKQIINDTDLKPFKYAYPNNNLTAQQVIDIKNGNVQAFQ